MVQKGKAFLPVLPGEGLETFSRPSKKSSRRGLFEGPVQGWTGSEKDGPEE
jgi:hypothetical protein